MTRAASLEPVAAGSSTVLIADDHTLVREGLRAVVAEIFPNAVVLEATDGESLLRAAYAGRSIRLAVVGSRMSGMDAGLRLVELARRHPELPIVVVSALDSCHAVRRSLSIATVFSVVHRGADVAHLRRAIEAAAVGTKLGYLQSFQGDQPHSILTPRQEEVHRLLRQGMSNKMIASSLGISEGTVKNHMTDIFRVLNASNRTQAAQHDPGAV